MNPEEKLEERAQERVFTIKEVVESELFYPNLKANFAKAMNPPTPPAGFKYKSRPWDKIRQNGIRKTEEMWDEYLLIKKKQSKLSHSEREFIETIVYKAMVATEKELQARANTPIKPQPKKRKTTKKATV